MFVERYIVKEGAAKQQPFSSIKKGDRFRIYEPNGELVIDSKYDIEVFTASSDAYINDDGIWTFDYAKES